MQLTPNYRLMKPDGTDPVNVQDLNSNMDVLDEEVIKKLDKAGDASNVVNAFSQAGTRTNLTSGEKLSTSLGKLMKWFADFAKVAFSGNYADLTGRPTIPAGGIADASKVIDDIDDIAANTQAGYMAGALALKKVNSDLANGQIEFDLQGGKGVYRQKGADAWLPFSNTLVLMDGTASAAFSGINVTRYSTFVLNNFDYSNYSKIRITNLGPYGYQVTCGTQLITADGTYDVSSLASDKLQVLYRGDTVNPNIMLRIELIP
ncbi:hypothetical protein [Eisenbergiella porci]|nr:hypothetical protein [Eisenbergiella porci]